MKNISKTIERILPDNITSLAERVMFLRHMFAYEYAKKQLKSDMDILDVGCGEGYGTSFLSHFTKTIVGIDVNSQIIEYAQNKYGSNNCKYELYDGSHANFKDERFDVIVSFQVIEHIDDDENFVNEVYRLLKPGGYFFITTPNKTMRLYPLQKPWNRFHLREYYPFELKKLLSTRFEQIEVFGIAAVQDIMDMESKRINQIQRNAANFLKKMVPAGIRGWLKIKFEILTARNNDLKNTKTELKEFSIDDFYIIKDDVYRGLDLLGICEKRISDKK